MNQLAVKFIDRLEERGIDRSMVPGFIRSLANTILINPQMDISQVNTRLHWLGWDDVELDYHTLQLAIACFEKGGRKELKDNSTKWYKNLLNSNHMSR